jgi:predicted nucleic acid-binding protein
VILVDTSVWIDHIRAPSGDLAALLMLGKVMQHRFVTVEVALGSLSRRPAMIEHLQSLPVAIEVDHKTLLAFIEETDLHAKGIGFVDAHLLASTLKIPEGRLWTRDKRLRAQAERLDISYQAD